MKKSTILGKALLSAAVLTLSLGTTSCKQESKPEDSKEAAEDQNDAKFEDNNAKEDDSEYLVDAAETDLEEIEVGKLAELKGTDAEVKSFGKMLVDDHTKSFQELKSFSDKKQISLPLVITEDGKEAFNDLDKKAGLDFDKKFAQMMVDGHESALKDAEKVSKDAKDEAIRLWAANKIPTLTAHLEHAKKLKERLDAKK